MSDTVSTLQNQSQIQDDELNSSAYLEDPNEFEKVKQYKLIRVSCQLFTLLALVVVYPI